MFPPQSEAECPLKNEVHIGGGGLHTWFAK